MIVTDRLIYLELQKTGGSHIRSLLKQYAGGVVDGKHNRLDNAHVDKVIIGSIRNPWDWYVSLWAYGTGGKGAIRAQTSRRLNFNYYHRMLPRAMGKNWLSLVELFLSIRHDCIKPVSSWQRTYVDADDPELFRDWLKLLLDKNRRYDVGEGYGFSPLSHHAGLMTYRYFRLFTLGDKVFQDQHLAIPEYIADYDRQFNVLGGMIKMESLETDFLNVLANVGVVLTQQQTDSIVNKKEGKTNASVRKSTAYYYDQETAALVAERDKYLIQKYGYQSPI